MLSFKDITDYYDLSENEATVLRFIITNTCAEAGVNKPEDDQISSTIDNSLQKFSQNVQPGNTTLN